MRTTFRSLAALLTLALFAVPWPGHAVTPAAVGTPSDLVVRAMSYNMLHAGAAASGKFPRVPAADLAWDRRDDQLAAWVRYEDPDVIGFQENLDTVEVGGRTVLQVATLVPQLDDYRFAQAGSPNPIAFRASAFTLLDDGATRIGTADGRSVLRDRFLTWAALRDRATGRRFLVFNVHLTASAEGAASPAARLAQARRVTALVRTTSRDYADPFVLTGDLNIADGSTGRSGAPLAHLAGAGLVSSSAWAVRTTTEVPGAVSLQSMTAVVAGTRTYKAVRTSGKTLDYVWAPRGALVRSYRVSTGPHTEQRTVQGESYWFYSAEPVLPSDHNPVVAEIAFSGALAPLGRSATRVGRVRVAGAVYETYLRRGGWEQFGLPLAERRRTAYRGVAVWTQRFTSGTIQWSSRAVRTSVSPGTTPLAGTGGFRDALAASGLRAGVVYRSGDLAGTTRTGRAMLGGLLDRGTIVDLRTPAERSLRPDPVLPGVARVASRLGVAASPVDLVDGAGDRAALRRALARVAAGSGPVLLHCGDNRVRTGWAVALLMVAAGAQQEAVVVEYARTPGAVASDLVAAIGRAEAGYGSMRGYLREAVGLSAAQLQAISERVG